MLLMLESILLLLHLGLLLGLLFLHHILFLSFPSCLLVDFFNRSQLLFQLHPPVLEPNFYLSFCKTKGMCYFYSPSSCQVMVKVELFFQFESLKSCVRLSTSTSRTSVWTWKEIFGYYLELEHMLLLKKQGFKSSSFFEYEKS